MVKMRTLICPCAHRSLPQVAVDETITNCHNRPDRSRPGGFPPVSDDATPHTEARHAHPGQLGRRRSFQSHALSSHSARRPRRDNRCGDPRGMWRGSGFDRDRSTGNPCRNDRNDGSTDDRCVSRRSRHHGRDDDDCPRDDDDDRPCCDNGRGDACGCRVTHDRARRNDDGHGQTGWEHFDRHAR